MDLTKITTLTSNILKR